MISFREKSLWVSLLVTAIIAGVFGNQAIGLILAGPSAPPQEIATLMIKVVIAFVILEVGLHVALSMDDQEGAGQKEDEREQILRLKANNLGYWVLSAGVVSCVIQQMINNNTGFEVQDQLANIANAHIELKLIIVFWLSELTRFATEIYFFRKDS